LIREVNGAHKLDAIDEVLGTGIYAQRWYTKELRDQLLGRHSGDLIGVSRFYLTLKPQVIVDFEPTPPDKFYLEEKRKFFMGKGIVYVPVMLKEKLSKEQFQRRVDDEKLILIRGYRESLQDTTILTNKDLKGPYFSNPEVLAYIQKESLRRLKEKKLKGVAAKKHLPHLTEQVVAELKGMTPDAIMDRVRGNQPVPVNDR
jgi:hypothetical protein